MGAAEHDRASIGQLEDGVAVRQRIDPRDGGEADDVAAVHAHEALRVEASLELGQLVAHEVLAVGPVDAHVLVLGAQAAHLIEGDREPALALPDDEALEVAAVGAGVARDQGPERVGPASVAVGAELRERLVERAGSYGLSR